MSSVLGVDGCRAGWYVALVREGFVQWSVQPSIGAALTLADEALAAAVAVDIPIGLPVAGSRECDVLARRLLSSRTSSVFPAPIRAVLGAGSYDEARAISIATHGTSISRQTFNILRKIAEVDAVADDPRVLEVHPEVSFARMAGRVLSGKKTAAGRVERLEALRTWLTGLDPPSVPPGDDAVDALAAAWTADRWRRGAAVVLPANPPLDARGRPMRIVV